MYAVFPHCEVRGWQMPSLPQPMISGLPCTLALLLSTGHLWGPELENGTIICSTKDTPNLCFLMTGAPPS